MATAAWPCRRGTVARPPHCDRPRKDARFHIVARTERRAKAPLACIYRHSRVPRNSQTGLNVFRTPTSLQPSAPSTMQAPALGVDNQRPLELAELSQQLRSTDPAALLVPPWLLRRVIKEERKVLGLGLRIPHRRCFVIS